MDFVTSMAGNMMAGDEDAKTGGGDMLDNVGGKLMDTIMKNKDEVIKTACSSLGLSVRRE